MSLRSIIAKPSQWPASTSRALQYGFYDFTREMPRTKRIIIWAAILVQGYAIYALVVRASRREQRRNVGMAAIVSAAVEAVRVRNS